MLRRRGYICRLRLRLLLPAAQPVSHGPALSMLWKSLTEEVLLITTAWIIGSTTPLSPRPTSSFDFAMSRWYVDFQFNILIATNLFTRSCLGDVPGGSFAFSEKPDPANLLGTDGRTPDAGSRNPQGVIASGVGKPRIALPAPNSNS